jgi:hypothetical protein
VLLATRLAGAKWSPLLDVARRHVHTPHGNDSQERPAGRAVGWSAGLEPVLFKGTALAYSVYPLIRCCGRGATPTCRAVA